jgi:hypothetical protein
VPRTLDPRALEITVTPGMRCMGPEARAEATQRHRNLLDRFRWSGPRRRRRLVHYLLGSVVLVPAMNWLFLPLPLRTLPLQLGVSALYGLLAGSARLGPRPAGCALVLALFATLALAGRLEIFQVRAAFGIPLFYFAARYAIGVGEDGARTEGD